MDRRKFIKISGASLSGLILGLPSFGNTGPGHLLALPDEVWISSGKERLSLISTDKLKWTNKDITVTITQEAEQLGVYVESTSAPLNNVQLNWKYNSASNTKCLVDHWERTYGDVSWQSTSATKKMPWYFMQYDGKETNCFGVATGANSICNWQITGNEIQLVLDTRSGGGGVQLGARKLLAADIITTRSIVGETPFKTGQRFCKMMCPVPRLAKQPV
ncbi:MAG: hypothetical protein ABI707_11035, partial [Ferruginibacter sp.]